MKKTIKSALLCTAIVVTGGIHAYGAEFFVPANVDPGAINRDLRLQSETRFIPDRQEEIDTSNIITKEASASYSTRTFKLNSVTYTGNTVVKTEALYKISAKLLGENVSLQDLNNVADSITDLYRQQGYLTSKAIVPPQVIKDGNVLIQIIEGKIGSITIDGGKWVKPNYVKNNLLKANSIEEDKVFNVNALTRSMSEVNSPKYLKGAITLEKGAKTGETDIVLDLKDRFPISLGLGWDNTGRDLVGVQRVGLFTSLDNVTGIGDRAWVNNTFASRTYGLDSGYSIPLGSKGTKLMVGYSSSNTNLGGEYRQYNIQGKSNNFTTAIIHPLLKGNDYELNSRIAFDIMNAQTTIFGNQNLNNYDLRILRAGVSGNKLDSKGRWIGDAIVSTGIPGLGATQTGNYGEPDSNFAKLNTYFTRVQKLPKNCMGIARLNTQLSTRTLFPAEQMQLGGAYTVRGYNEASMLGDAGYVLSFEVRTPIPFLPKNITARYWKDKSIKIPIKDSIKLAAFYDQGWTSVIQQGISPNSQNFFNSVGAGLRISLGHHTTANIDLGCPIGPPKYDGQAPVRLHFSISTDLL